jgi:glycosyltransferase involved in cell wall biosynthesis
MSSRGLKHSDLARPAAIAGSHTRQAVVSAVPSKTTCMGKSGLHSYNPRLTNSYTRRIVVATWDVTMAGEKCLGDDHGSTAAQVLSRDTHVARPPHVLLVAPYTSSGGGMGQMMAYVANHATSKSEPQPVQFERVESRGAGIAIFSAWPTLRAAWRIWQLARAAHPTIVHVNMAERGSVLRKGLLLFLARRCGLPTVLHLHAAEIISTYDEMPRAFRAWMGMVFRSASVCVVLGKPWQIWLQQALGVAAGRIEVLPNGVPSPPVVPFPASPPRCLLVFLGNLLPRKGLPDLIAALADDDLRHRQWDLVVAGAGDVAPLRRQIELARLDGRIRFVGWLGRADTTALLARATMLILPSYQEGMPLVLLEAASLGVPAVTTLSGAIPEIFTHRKTALLIKAGDIRALALSIRLLIDDPVLRAQLGRNAYALFERRLSIEIFYRGLLDIYRRHCFPLLEPEPGVPSGVAGHMRTGPQTRGRAMPVQARA